MILSAKYLNPDMKFIPVLIGCSFLFLNSCGEDSEIDIDFSLRAPGLSKDNTIYITGNMEQLGLWRPDSIKMEYKSDSTWTKTISIDQPGFIEYKYTLGSWQTEASDSNRLPLSNFRANVSVDTVIENKVLFWTSKERPQRKSTITGTIKYHHNFKNDSILPRDILVWLPPDYEKDSTKHYPVLYMHDGQNIFDAATSSFGNEWRVDETCDSLISAGKIPPLIVVGINNSHERSIEYLPGTKGNAYMDFVVNTLKTFIDKTYRTNPEAENTIVAGSSSAGTISFMITWEYPHIFSKAICMSPALKIAEIDYVKVVNSAEKRKEVFLYIDNGGVDLELRLQPGIDEMITALKEKGYQQGKDFVLIIDPVALHNEVAWAKRLPKALQLCFPVK